LRRAGRDQRPPPGVRTLMPPRLPAAKKNGRKKVLVSHKNRRYIGAVDSLQSACRGHRYDSIRVRAGIGLFHGRSASHACGVGDAGGPAMTDHRTERDYDETEEALMNEDIEWHADDAEDEQDEPAPRGRGFNLDMRHRIEDRLEQRRLARELSDYEFFDLDDDDTLH